MAIDIIQTSLSPLFQSRTSFGMPFELRTSETDQTVIQANNFIAPLLNMTVSPALRRIQPGDFVELKLSGSTPYVNCLNYIVTHDSEGDTYALVPVLMAYPGPPSPPTPGATIVAAQRVTWSGSGATLSVSVPGALTTDIPFTSFIVRGTGVLACSARVALADNVLISLNGVSDTGNLSVINLTLVRPS